MAMKKGHIYLSPHLDDAALSSGGSLHNQRKAGERVSVITIFAGLPDYSILSPFPKRLHHPWGDPPNPVALRRAEDTTVMQSLGANYLHLNYPDGIYRSIPAAGGDASFLYSSAEELLGELNPVDLPLVAELEANLLRLLWQESEAILYSPMAIGNHVDHQIVQMAALVLGKRGHTLLFYEDFPYSEREGSLERAQTRWPKVRWGAKVQDISASLQAKVEAISGYASQIKDPEEMARRVRSYAAAIQPEGGYCERFWYALPDH